MSKLPPEPPDSMAAHLRRRFAEALTPANCRTHKVPIIGRGCVTDEFFTYHIAQALGMPRLHQAPGETESQFLIRRLNQIKFISRFWSLTRLEALDADTLELAAMQICDAAANYAQDRACERELTEQKR